MSDLPYGLARDDWCDNCFMDIHHEGERANYSRGTGIVVLEGEEDQWDAGDLVILEPCGCPCQGA